MLAQIDYELTEDDWDAIKSNRGWNLNLAGGETDMEKPEEFKRDEEGELTQRM